MAERIPWKAKLAAATVALPIVGLVLGACGDDGDKKEPTTAATATFTPVVIREVVTATPTVTPRTTLSPSPTLRAESPSPATTLTPGATGVSPTTTGTPKPNAENYALSLSGPSGWVEVANSADLQGFSEFTILARIKVSGDGPDTILAKGENIEAYAFYADLRGACRDGDMAMAINSKPLCSGIVVPKNQYVNVALTYKDGAVRFFANEAQSAILKHDQKVPIEFGPLFIGYSPYGPKEGLNGQIDLLGILNQGLSEDQVKLVFAAINSGADVSKFIVATNGVVAVWPFERSAPFHDVTGNGHEGTPKGSVTLAPVTTP